MRADSAGLLEWERTYQLNGDIHTSPSQVFQTSDGGFLVMGPAWLLKLDQDASVQWSKSYHGGLFLFAEQTSDGGYIIAGSASGPDPSDGWVVRLDSQGNLLWQEMFRDQDVYFVDQTRDGGFVIAGTVCVCGSTNRQAAAWVFKLIRNGDVLWQKAYLVSGRSDAYSVKQTRDGGYIVAGHSSLGALILRLDRNGDIIWQRSYSGSGFSASSVIQVSDGGFVVLGGSLGPYLLKLDNKGNTVWLRTYRYGQYGFLSSVYQTKSGN